MGTPENDIDVWRDRVHLARLRYDSARQSCLMVVQNQMRDALPGSDGMLAVQLAHRQEREALNEYMRCLRVFTDLVLRGIH